MEFIKKLFISIFSIPLFIFICGIFASSLAHENFKNIINTGIFLVIAFYKSMWYADSLKLIFLVIIFCHYMIYLGLDTKDKEREFYETNRF